MVKLFLIFLVSITYLIAAGLYLYLSQKEIYRAKLIKKSMLQIYLKIALEFLMLSMIGIGVIFIVTMILRSVL